jgi:hypothetical protein
MGSVIVAPGSVLPGCDGWPLAFCTCNTVNSNCPAVDTDPNSGAPLNLTGLYQVQNVGFMGFAPQGWSTPGSCGATSTTVQTPVSASFSLNIPAGVTTFYYSIGMLGSVDGLPANGVQCSTLSGGPLGPPCPHGGNYPVDNPPTGPCGPCCNGTQGFVACNVTFTFPNGGVYGGYGVTGSGFESNETGGSFGQAELVDLADGSQTYALLKHCGGPIPYQQTPFVKQLPQFGLAASPFTPYTAQPSDFANFTVTLAFNGFFAPTSSYQKSGQPSFGEQPWGTCTSDVVGSPFTVTAVGVGVYWVVSAIGSSTPKRRPNVCINM